MPRYANDSDFEWDALDESYRPLSQARQEARQAELQARCPYDLAGSHWTDEEWIEWGVRLTDNPPPKLSNIEMYAMSRAAQAMYDTIDFCNRFEEFLNGKTNQEHPTSNDRHDVVQEQGEAGGRTSGQRDSTETVPDGFAQQPAEES